MQRRNPHLVLLMTIGIVAFSCKSGEQKTESKRTVVQAGTADDNAVSSDFKAPSTVSSSSKSTDIEEKSIFQKDYHPIYWYSSINKYDRPRDDQTSFSMPYMGKWNPDTRTFGFGDEDYWLSKVKPYLDNAHSMNQKVILDLKLGTEDLSYETHHSKIFETAGREAAQKIIDFVKMFDDHPAVVGWYTQDEPSLHFRKDKTESKWDEGYVTGYHKSRAAYRLVKEANWGNSKKPVFIGFASSPEVISSASRDIKDSVAYKYRFAYDRAITHFYPYRNNLDILSPTAVKYQFSKFV